MRCLLRQSVVDWDAPLRISGLDRRVLFGAISNFGNARRETRQVADAVVTAIISRESECAE